MGNVGSRKNLAGWHCRHRRGRRQLRRMLGDSPLDLDFCRVRLLYSVDLTVDELQACRIGVAPGQYLRYRQIAPIGRRAGILDNPALAVSDPQAFAKATVGFKCPREYPLAARIPANDFGTGMDRVSLAVDDELADQETTVGGPIAVAFPGGARCWPIWQPNRLPIPPGL